MTIYADVLFVVNFFITYLLLMLTKALIKTGARMFRLLAASFIGGLYSLTIFISSLGLLLTVVGRILVSLLIVFAAFGFKRLWTFIKAVMCFYFSNLLFVGVILALWLTLKPKGIVINNDVVYFDIPAYALLVLALVSYVVSVGVIKLYNHTISKKEIYSLTVVKRNEEYRFFAFCDSGNKLVEPFSSYPVIIVDESKIDVDTERVIPYSTVGGEGMLRAFKPDKVIISNGKNTFETNNVYVATGKVNSKSFTAILNPDLISK